MLTNRSAPPATVTPVLIYPDVRAAVAWLEAAFGFEERVRVGDSHRAQLRVGSDGAVVVADVRGDQVAPSDGVVTQLLKVRVPGVDAAFARARGCGARVVISVADRSDGGEHAVVVERLRVVGAGVLASSVAVMDQLDVGAGAALSERHLERVEDEVRAHVRRELPADDGPAKGVDHE